MENEGYTCNFLLNYRDLEKKEDSLLMERLNNELNRYSISPVVYVIYYCIIISLEYLR